MTSQSLLVILMPKEDWMSDEYEIVLSPLCQKITRHGLTIDVQIYRGLDDEGSILEVVDENGGSTVWSDPFRTDEAALSAVMGIIATEGIASFLEDSSKKPH